MESKNARAKPSFEGGERELKLTRVFKAPRELVFDAWIDPQHLAHWWGPKGFSNPVCKLDVRVGGLWEIVMRSPEGIEYPCHGIYREIIHPERLVFTNIATDRQGTPVLNGLTTVTFSEEDGQTKVILHTRAIALVPDALEKLAGMEAGWSQSLDRLVEELAAFGRT